MMKRNTILMAGLLVLGLLASCKKDDNTAVVGQGFVAQTEQGNGSRTYGVDDGSNISVMWSAGDQILVANGSGSTLTYTLKRGANSTEATFASADETQEFFQPNYVAIYPATNANNEANTIQQTSDGVSAIFNLPATQTYQSNSFGVKAVPMVAYSDSDELQFKNVLGGVCFPIVGDGFVTKIVLTSNVDEALWGTCTTTVSTEGDAPVSTVSNTATDKNVITLDCGTGVIVGTAPRYFYVMVPEGTLAGGFNVKVYSGDDVLYDHNANANTLTVSRNQVLKLENPITVHALPEGALNGVFTKDNLGHRIMFSKGSLRYNPAQGKWRFADVQYIPLHTVADDGKDISNEYNANYDGWIELFGWGCTGRQDALYHDNQSYYQPYETATDDATQYGPTGEHDLDVSRGSDWGAVTIENGEDYGWRLWDIQEVLYIMNERETESGIRYAWAVVDGYLGIIIVPDNWDNSLYTLEGANTLAASPNIISLEDWTNIVEANGVMFMSCAGYRIGTIFCQQSDGSNAMYWSRNPNGIDKAICPGGVGGDISFYDYIPRSVGFIVRLIRDVD